MRVGVCGPTGGRTSKLTKLAETHGIELVNVEFLSPRPEDIWLIVIVGQTACKRLFDIDLNQAVGFYNWIDGRLWTAIGEGTDGLVDMSSALHMTGLTGTTGRTPQEVANIMLTARHKDHMTATWGNSEKAIISLHSKGKMRAIKEVNRIKKLLNVTLVYWD